MGKDSVLCPDKHDARLHIACGAVDAFGVLIQPGLKPIRAILDIADIETGGSHHRAETVRPRTASREGACQSLGPWQHRPRCFHTLPDTAGEFELVVGRAGSC